MTHGRVGVKVAAILDLCKFEGGLSQDGTW